MIIRKAEEKDLEDIKEIEKESFSIYLNTDFNRKIENIRINYEICEGGLFVAEIESQIKGFIFARELGKIGWIGTFAVSDKMQKRGIGKELLKKAIEYLESSGCEIIGLETLNTAFKNIEIYLKSGFQAIKPSFQLTRKTEESENYSYISNLNEKYVEILSNKVLRGYNPIKIFKSATNMKWGETIEFKEGNDCFGVALLEFMPKLENEKKGTLTVNTLLIDESDETKIKNTIKEINAYAVINGFESIDIFLNSENENMLKILLCNGFRIKNSRIRMLIKGGYEPEGIECSRWIM